MRLSISSVSKKYGDLIALHPFTMELEGKIYGLIGNNGAGKSTLMKMIVGLIPPGKGKIMLGDLNAKETPEAVKKYIGYLPESPLLYPRLTPEEFLTYVSDIKGMTEQKDEIEHWLDYFGLASKRNAFLNDLSYGMKKKVAISAALIGKPALLVLDEPFNGLDVATMEALSGIITRRHAEGVTIILSSHLMAYIERLCHETVILKKGKVAAQGPPEELKKEAEKSTFHDVFLHYTQDNR